MRVIQNGELLCRGQASGTRHITAGACAGEGAGAQSSPAYCISINLSHDARSPRVRTFSQSSAWLCGTKVVRVDGRCIT